MNLLKATEVARILRVSTARVYDLARRRMLPALTLGERQIRFEEDALCEWIAAGGSAINTNTRGAAKGGIADGIAASAL